MKELRARREAWKPCVWVSAQAALSSFQRIAAISMPQALSYFGRSVDGRLDLDGDDLIDVAVGAQGAAVLLRWMVSSQVTVNSKA